MFEPIENLYFNWLCAKVYHVRNSRSPETSYDGLLRILHNTEFAWTISGDDNRAEDGKELRREFLIMGDIPDHLEWRTMTPCSVFEMLIAFAKRAEFYTDFSTREWFWTMIDNLGLKGVTDAEFNVVDPLEVIDTLEHFMWRRYLPNGDGGLFPLTNPSRDQTQIEIWDQFSDYLVDRRLLPA